MEALESCSGMSKASKAFVQKEPSAVFRTFNGHAHANLNEHTDIRCGRQEIGRIELGRRPELLQHRVLGTLDFAVKLR